jgi:hypothetical protein
MRGLNRRAGSKGEREDEKKEAPTRKSKGGGYAHPLREAQKKDAAKSKNDVAHAAQMAI